MVWFLRSRAPLSLVIYRAALEDRLLWWSADRLALLEEPSGSSTRPAQAPRRATWLRWLDRWWDLLWLLLPPVLLLAAAGTLLPIRSARPVALVLALLSLVYVALGMAAFVVPAFRWLYRVLVTADEAVLADLAVGQVLSRHWAMPLCHLAHLDQIDELLDGVRQRGDVVGPVLLLERGVTSSAIRLALRRDQRVRPLLGASRVLLLSGNDDWSLLQPASTPVQAARGIPLMVGALLVTLAASAELVAGWERAACAGAECAARPSTYWDAFYWLLNRLSGGDPEGLGARTFQARSIGLAFTLVSVVLIGWVVASLLQQAIGHAQRVGSELVLRQNEHEESLLTPSTLGADPAAGSPPEPTSARVMALLTAGALVGAVVGRLAGSRRDRRGRASAG